MTFEKIFPIYTMVYNSFCKEEAAICFEIAEELKRIRPKYRIRKLLCEPEALEKKIEYSKIIGVIRTLKVLEDEIKAS